ncbi:hypothetical protein ACU6VI_05810 [Sphaerotilus natans]|uniref:hypothetical protein n=1 Tax=Sphaerotilus natans TaxID=34103 RepID=UPI00406C1AE6
MNIGDDISNLLRQIGPEAGIYQDVSQYNAARGGNGRRGLFGRTQPAALTVPADLPQSPQNEPTAPSPTEPARPETAAVSPTGESSAQESADIRLDPAETPEDNEARFAPLQPATATPVAFLLQAPAARTEPAPTLAAEVPAAPARPTSLSSLARRLSGEARPADGLDLSALGEGSAGTSREPAAAPTQRLDRLFDRLASSQPR